MLKENEIFRMTRLPIRLLLCVMSSMTLAGVANPPPSHPLPAILGCDQSQQRIVLLDSNSDWSNESAIKWQWSANSDQAVQAEHRKWFRNPTDAKCVALDKHLLTVASGGAVARVDMEKSRVVAYGYAGRGAHSVAQLPDGLIVTASSSGNLVQLFEPNKQNPSELKAIQKVTLSDAHGVTWDNKRGCLWALGGKQMKQLAYDPEKTVLSDRATIDLPVTEESVTHPRHGGHDLVWDKDKKSLLLSDMDHLWAFDPDTLEFTALVPQSVKSVKSISQHPNTTHIILMQATTKWWSDSVVSLDGSWKKTLPGARFYKARWYQE